jgi:nucleotide-binding universal stress UspA family protein
MIEARKIHRILVALDASPHSLAALKAAAALAADLQAELLGMFVEDINLLRLAGLPGAREIVSSTGGVRELDTQRLERALRAQAAELEHALAAAAEGSHIRWTFRVARGRVVRELLTAAQEADMLVLGRLGRSLLQRSRLGSTAQAIAASATRTVVFLEHGIELGPPVVALFDGSDSSWRALTTAAQLTHEQQQKLVVLIAGANAVVEHLQARASERLGQLQCSARFRTVADLANLHQIVRQEGGNMLVLAADHALAREETLPELMERVKCPVVLVR